MDSFPQPLDPRGWADPDRLRLTLFGHRFSPHTRHLLRERIKEKESVARCEREIQGEMRFAAGAISDATGIAQEDTLELLKLYDRRPERTLTEATSSLLAAFDRSFPEKYQGFQKALQLYERWLTSVDASQTLRHVLTANPPYDQMLEALRARPGACTRSSLEGEEMEMVTGEYCLGWIYDLAEEQQRYKAGIIEKVAGFGAALNQVYLSGHRQYHERFVEDSVAELLLNSYGPTVNLPGFERYVRKRIALLPASDLVSVLMSETVSSYIALAELDPRASLLATHRPAGVSPADSVRGLERALRKVAQAGIRLPDTSLTQLFRGTPDESKIELLEKLSESPVLLALWEKVMKAVNSRAYAGFVLGETALDCSAEPHLAEDLLSYVTREGRPQAAAQFITAAPAEWHAPDFQQVWRLARESNGSGPAFEAYLIGIASGHRSRTLLASVIINQAADTAELKRLGEKLIIASEKSLEWVAKEAEAGSAYARFKAMHAVSKEQKGRATSKSSWLDTLLAEVAEGRFPGLDSEALARTIAAAGETGRVRIRNVWHSRPSILADCCRIIAEFGDRKQFQLLLGSPELFSLFNRRLVDCGAQKVDAELRKLCGTFTDNPYRALTGWLRGEKIDKELAALAEKVELDQLTPQQVAQGSIDRIMIVGGKFRAEAEERIKRSAPAGVEIEVYSEERGRPDLRSLDPRTLIIWITAANSHSEHDAVKRQAVRVGTAFCYYTRSGAAGLAESLSSLLAAARASR